MVRRLIAAILVALICMSLSGCAVVSALASRAMGGHSADSSTNVEANVAAGDNKKAVFSSESNRSYANKGNVINNGVDAKDVWKTIVASAVHGIDSLLTLIAILVYAGFSKYLSVRADIFERRLKLKMAELKLKELKSKK